MNSVRGAIKQVAGVKTPIDKATDLEMLAYDAREARENTTVPRGPGPSGGRTPCHSEQFLPPSTTMQVRHL